MIKDKFYIKCANYDFENLFKTKGYAYFTKGNYNLNIIGVRNSEREITNLFDDILVVIYNSGKDQKPIRKLYKITTEPGLYYMKEHILNNAGAAILVPAQYRGCWKIGMHKGTQRALVQVKPVKVYRDGNKNDIYDMNPETIENGIFGINIHRASKEGITRNINKYSAGCQVFNSVQDFTSFMYLCDKQAELYGNSFTYTLVNEDDLV